MRGAKLLDELKAFYAHDEEVKSAAVGLHSGCERNSARAKLHGPITALTVEQKCVLVSSPRLLLAFFTLLSPSFLSCF